jgi:transmembrane sensor
MTQPNLPGDRTSDAVECFLCLADPDAEPAARARWTAWLGANDQNRAAYHRVRDSWNRPVPGDVWPSHAEILGDDYNPDEPVPMRQTKGAGRVTHRWRRSTSEYSPGSAWLMPIAGVLLVAVIVASWSVTRSPRPEAADALVYRTARGEQRRIALSDGSAVTLGPLSTLSVTAGSDGRSARLDGGEAIFAVIHDPARPFRLLANGGQIEDVGTTFAVEIHSGTATVTVVDGAVKVSPRAASTSADVRRDEQVSFAAELGPVGPVDGRLETDWSRGRLAYVDQPLIAVVADLTRYTTRDIVLADREVGALHYTGTIEADAIDQWAAALTRVLPVGATHDGTRLILRSMPKN